MAVLVVAGGGFTGVWAYAWVGSGGDEQEGAGVGGCVGTVDAVRVGGVGVGGGGWSGGGEVVEWDGIGWWEGSGWGEESHG